MNSSELRQHLQQYLELRDAIGFKVRNSRLLYRFVEFASQQCDSTDVSATLVCTWVDLQSGSASAKAKRLGVVRPFLDYLGCCFPEVQQSFLRLYGSQSRSKPFLFESLEVERMLSAAERFGANDSFFRMTLSTIIGLLACTGLRISEALSLDRRDVMPKHNPRALYIRETKFRKSRIVPVHASTAEKLAAYAGHRMLLEYDLKTEAFFVSDAGQRLSYGTVAGAFHHLLDELQIEARDGSRPPSIHSLRHTFVMNCLLRWHSQKIDVHTRLAHLATYLGHVDFGYTYWYVSCLPQLLGSAADAFTAPISAEAQS
jgi:integrase